MGNVVPQGLQVAVGGGGNPGNSSQCVLFGTIAVGVGPGTYTFTVRAADNSSPPQTDDETYTITVSSLQVTVTAAANGTTVVGEPIVVTWNYMTQGTLAIPMRNAVIELRDAATNTLEDSCASALGNTNPNGNGGCTLTAGGQTAGAKNVVLIYPDPMGTPDPGFLGGAGAVDAHTVLPADTSVAVMSASTTGGGTTEFQESVTFTATVTIDLPGGPGSMGLTGTVDFVDTTTMLPLTGCTGVALSGTAPGSTATCTVSDLAVGAHNVQATYDSGNTDPNFNSDMGAIAHTVIQALTGTVVTSMSTTGGGLTVFQEPVTFTATVSLIGNGSDTPIGFSGTVDFFDTTTMLPLTGCTGVALSGALSGSTATCTVSDLAVGGHNVQATYDSGNTDGNFATSMGALAHTVNQAVTTLVITPPALGTVVGQQYTVTWTLAVNAPGSGAPIVPTGNVDITDGTDSCPTTPVAAGMCMMTSTTSGAPHTLTATYTGDGNFLGDTDAQPHTVGPAPTTSSVACLPMNTSVFQEPVTCTATVSSSGAGMGEPVGSVDFFIDGMLLQNVALTQGAPGSNMSTATTMATNTLAVSPPVHTVDATYIPNANFVASMAPQIMHTVNKAATTLTITPPAMGTTVGQQYTVTWTLTVNGPGAGAPTPPTGNVTVTDGTDSCPATPVANGSCMMTSTTSGAPKTLTGTYLGDGNFLGDVDMQSHNVAAAATTVALTSNMNPALAGATVTLTATISITPPGMGTPTGTVNFRFVGGATIMGTMGSCNMQPVSAGAATCMTNALPTGTNNLEAVFISADPANIAGSTSPPLQQFISETTTTTLGSNFNPSVFQQTVTFTAMVTGDVTAAPATGIVTFRDGGVAMAACTGMGLMTGQVALVAGQATCTLNTLSVATHNITSDYTATVPSQFLDSPSNLVMQVVNSAATAVALTSNSPLVMGIPTSVFQQSVTLTATITVTGFGSASPTPPMGTVNFRFSPGGAIVGGCSMQPVSTAMSVTTATCTLNTLPVAMNSLEAVYTPPMGNLNFTGNTSPALTQNVTQAATTLTITAPAAGSNVSTGVAFTVNWSLAVNLPGSNSPTFPGGTVTVTDGTAMCSNPVNSISTGVGSCQFTTMAAAGGMITLTATYGGDANFVMDSDAIMVNVVTPVALTDPAMTPVPLGTRNVAYAGYTLVTGGAPPYQLIILSGTVTHRVNNTSVAATASFPPPGLMFDNTTGAISMTAPTFGGIFTYVIDVVGNSGGPRTYTFDILGINKTVYAQGSSNQAYSEFVDSGGTLVAMNPYTNGPTTGTGTAAMNDPCASLPMDPTTGQITDAGSPPAGTCTFSVTVNGSGSRMDTRTGQTIVFVGNNMLVINAQVIGNGTEGRAFSQNITTNGQGGNLTSCVVSAGALPTGFNAPGTSTTSCTLTGTPAMGSAGTYPFTLSATNASNTATRQFTLIINPPLNINPPATDGASLGTATKGQSFSFTFGRTGGNPSATGTFTWAISGAQFTANAGNMNTPCEGLSFNTTTGTLSGVPSGTTSGTCGSFNVTVTDTASASTVAGMATRMTLTLNVSSGPLNITSIAPLGNGTQNRALLTSVAGVRFPVGGGVPPYMCSITGQPAGVNAVAVGNFCELQGTPMASGTFNSVNVTVTDSLAAMDSTGTFSWTINAPLVLTTASLGDTVAGRMFMETLTNTGGQTPFTWSVTAGQFTGNAGTPTTPCQGLTLGAMTGVLNGTSVNQGMCSPTIQVMDTATSTTGAGTSSVMFSFNVNADLAFTSAANPGDAVDGSNYSTMVTASGGLPLRSFNDNGGTLAADADCASFSFDAAGNLTATPALRQAPGAGVDNVCDFTAQVQDTASTSTASCTTLATCPTQAMTIPIQPTLTIATTTLPNAKRGSAYLPTSVGGLPGAAVQATGGTGTPYTYSETSGSFTCMAGTCTGMTGACVGLSFPQAATDQGSGADVDTVISGSPTTAGTCNLTMQVADIGSGPTASGMDTQALSIVVIDSFAYVTAPGTSTLEVINTATNVYVSSIALDGAPDQVAVTKDGRFAVVTIAGNLVNIVDTTTNTLVVNAATMNTMFATPCQGEGIDTNDLAGIKPRAYIACTVGDNVVALDLDPADVGTMAFGAINANIGSLSTGGTGSARRVAFNAAGNRLFVSIDQGAAANAEFAVIDTTSDTAVMSSPFTFNPGMALTDCEEPVGVHIATTAFTGNPEEAYFVCSGNDSVAIVAVATTTHVASVALPATSAADSVAFAPSIGANAARAYVTLNALDQVEVISTSARTSTTANLPDPAMAAVASIGPLGIVVPEDTAVEVFIALSGTVMNNAPGVAILNDAASPTSGTNNPINPASTPAFPGSTSPTGIAAVPIPRPPAP